MDPIRQGDVLLVPIEDRARAAKIRADGETIKRQRGEGHILAAGEATGHHHRVRTPRVRMIRHGSNRYIDVPKSVKAKMVHEEHSTLTIPAGLFRVDGQREYKPQAAPTRVYD